MVNWVTKGNFQFFKTSGGPLRTIVYQNTQSNASISEIELFGYSDGRFLLCVKPKSKEYFSPLSNAIVNAGFPVPPSTLDTDFQEINFSTTDIPIIGIYMCALAQQEPTVRDLMVPMANLFGLPMFEESYQLPLWYIDGNFQIFNSGGILNRRIVYTNRPNNTIYKIKLGGYHDGHFRIAVETKTDEHFSQLTKVILSAGFQIGLMNSPGHHELDHKTLDKEQVILFFQTLGNEDKTVNVLIESIKGLLNSDPKYDFEKRRNKIKLPESKIPEEFYCAISLELMSDPVYTMDCHQQKFERTNFETWLRENNRHPYNSKITVTNDKIVSDTELKSKMDVFFTQKEKEHAAAAASKIQYWYRHRKNIERQDLQQKPEHLAKKPRSCSKTQFPIS